MEFRPLAVAKVLNVAIATLLIAVPTTLANYFHAPTWVVVTLSLPAVLWIGHAAKLFVSRVTIDAEGVHFVGFFRRSISWNDIEAWSDHGEDNPVYFRTRCGKVIGFDGWCIFGDRFRQVASRMHQHLGSPAVGENAVLPWFFRLASQHFGQANNSGEESNG